MWWRRKREEDLERELRSHIESEAEERQDYYAARRAFGNMTSVKEEVREMWALAWLDSIWQDVRYGLRGLRKSRGFAAVAVLTLALGIGANTAIFSVVDAVLLNRMPYADAGRLVMVWEQNPARGWFQNIVSAANFVDWRKDNHVFTQMAAIQQGAYDVSGTGEPLEVRGEAVSGDFFSVLGVQAALGRTFTPAEDQPGGARVVVLSNELWKERYGGDPGLVGREITVSRLRFTVIGVMAPAFHFPPWGDKAGLWTTGLDLRNPDRVWHNYMSIARLRPGVTMERARAEMDTIGTRLEKEHPEQAGWGVQLVNLHEQVVGDTRPALLVLLAAVGMVLLIACVNVANLQLARVAAREKEIALRAALGGGRRRLIRQLLTESMLLAFAGGVLGVLLAGFGVKLLVTFGPQDIPGLSQAGVNGGVLVFTLIVSVTTGIAFGLLPALGASKVDLTRCLRASGRSATHGPGGRRLLGMLVSSEFALALILLVGAGLLIRSFVALTRVDLGFDPHNVLTMRIALLGFTDYAKRSTQTEFFRTLVQKVEALPGVISAAAIDGGGLPPSGGSGMGLFIEGRPTPPPSEMPDANYRVISPDYFRTMRIPLVRGRYLADSDNENAPHVAVINEKLARDYWPGRNPIGSRVRFPGLVENQPTWFSIVGVVKSVKNRGIGGEPKEEIYVPYSQYPAYFVPRTLVVRTSGDPTYLTAAIRHQVEMLDKDQPISDVMTMDQYVAKAEAGRRFPMVLLALFAALALLLAGIGIYGVMSYSVSQRTHEFGIRMALGAQSRDVLKPILGEGMRLAAIGLLIGVAGALAATRAMSGLLYSVRPTDALTFISVSLALFVIGSLASYIPARRAARIDPMVALKDE